LLVYTIADVHHCWCSPLLMFTIASVHHFMGMQVRLRKSSILTICNIKQQKQIIE